jgi:hypothetical protein
MPQLVSYCKPALHPVTSTYSQTDFFNNFVPILKWIASLELKGTCKHARCATLLWFYLSPVGVATEYLKDTIVLRDYVKPPSLSERATIIIDGRTYEEDPPRQICPMPCPEECAHSTTKHCDFRALRLDTKATY